MGRLLPARAARGLGWPQRWQADLRAHRATDMERRTDSPCGQQRANHRPNERTALRFVASRARVRGHLHRHVSVRLYISIFASFTRARAHTHTHTHTGIAAFWGDYDFTRATFSVTGGTWSFAHAELTAAGIHVMIVQA